MPGSRNEVQDRLPLSPAVFQILLSLARGERHGYAMMRDVEETTGGRTKLAPGTLYYSLQKMLERGLIEEGEDRPADDADDQRRIYYRITEHGRRVAEAEAQRLAELVDLARARDLLERAEEAG